MTGTISDQLADLDLRIEGLRLQQDLIGLARSARDAAPQMQATVNAVRKTLADVKTDVGAKPTLSDVLKVTPDPSGGMPYVEFKDAKDLPASITQALSRSTAGGIGAADFLQNASEALSVQGAPFRGTQHALLGRLTTIQGLLKRTGAGVEKLESYGTKVDQLTRAMSLAVKVKDGATLGDDELVDAFVDTVALATDVTKGLLASNKVLEAVVGPFLDTFAAATAQLGPVLKGFARQSRNHERIAAGLWSDTFRANDPEIRSFEPPAPTEATPDPFLELHSQVELKITELSEQRAALVAERQTTNDVAVQHELAELTARALDRLRNAGGDVVTRAERDDHSTMWSDVTTVSNTKDPQVRAAAAERVRWKSAIGLRIEAEKPLLAAALLAELRARPDLADDALLEAMESAGGPAAAAAREHGPSTAPAPAVRPAHEPSMLERAQLFFADVPLPAMLGGMLAVFGLVAAALFFVGGGGEDPVASELPGGGTVAASPTPASSEDAEVVVSDDTEPALAAEGPIVLEVPLLTSELGDVLPLVVLDDGRIVTDIGALLAAVPDPSSAGIGALGIAGSGLAYVVDCRIPFGGGQDQCIAFDDATLSQNVGETRTSTSDVPDEVLGSLDRPMLTTYRVGRDADGVAVLVSDIDPGPVAVAQLRVFSFSDIGIEAVADSAVLTALLEQVCEVRDCPSPPGIGSAGTAPAGFTEMVEIEPPKTILPG